LDKQSKNSSTSLINIHLLKKWKGGEKKMNKKTIALGITTLTIGGLTLGSTAVDAYRGDPSIQGPNYTEERHQAISQAFANNDYTAWKDLMSGKGRATQVITQENFSKFAEAHSLALAGQLDQAREIRAELGLGLGNQTGNGSGQGSMGQGRGQGRNR
jgi:hypothetical protein